MSAQLPEVPGKLTLDARKKLTLTGAREVVRFDEELVELNTDLGALTIEGRELKLKCLSLDDGTVVVCYLLFAGIWRLFCVQKHPIILYKMTE